MEVAPVIGIECSVWSEGEVVVEPEPFVNEPQVAGVENYFCRIGAHRHDQRVDKVFASVAVGPSLGGRLKQIKNHSPVGNIADKVGHLNVFYLLQILCNS